MGDTPSSVDFAQRAFALLSAGRAPDAVALLEQRAALVPPDPPSLGLLAMALGLAGRTDEAIARSREAIAILSAQGKTDPALLINLGAMLSSKKEHDEALALLARARQLAPHSVEACTGLASALRAAGRFSDALQTVRPLMNSGPGGQAPRDPRILSLVADLLWDVGRTDQAAPLLATAVRLAPADPRLAALAANLHNYLPTTAAESLAAHTRAASFLTLAPASAAPVPRSPITPPLRVGLVSADLREHSCAYFLLPLLENLDPARVQVYAYFTLDKYDGFSERIASRCAAFRRVHAAAPNERAALIRADRLDVLIETDGLSPNHSLAAVALRPAPRIITWLGYPNTTGLEAVHARIVDAITDPPGSEGACRERLERLDRCFVCYQPPADAPEVRSLPALTSDSVTFGCFNTFFKFTRQTLTAYAAVLKAVPNSTLIIKNKPCGDPGVARDLALRFKELGIDPARIRPEGWKDHRNDHLSAYHSIDIALDSMPYCGTTTTCESLFMGVPVITLRGSAHSARVGASLLHAINLDSLVCTDIDTFAASAARLAADLPSLSALRATLRPRLLASPLCDGPEFARAFTASLERIVTAG